MKKLSLLSLFSAAVIAICTSCGGKSQVSPRVPIWDDDADYSKSVSLSSKNVIVPFERTSDLAQVQISLNGVPFNMWWDTGASMTCISALELQKLAKGGKIELDDYQGSVVSRIADGSTSESLVFNIKEIFIQGRDNQYLILHDVAAAVSPNTGAPLLIGQNIIQNLPRHVFHEDEGVIVFEQQ